MSSGHSSRDWDSFVWDTDECSHGRKFWDLVWGSEYEYSLGQSRSWAGVVNLEKQILFGTVRFLGHGEVWWVVSWNIFWDDGNCVLSWG